MSNKGIKKRRDPTRHRKQPAKKRVKRVWTLPTALSLIIGAVGALGVVELRPKIVVYPQEPLLDAAQPFSAPFRITNNGYLSVGVERINCYVQEVRAAKLYMGKDLYDQEDWDGKTLDRGESETVLCKVAQVKAWPEKADIAIVVDYRAWPIPLSSRRYFRFVGSGSSDNWQWLPQPSADIKADADSAIHQWKGY